MEAAPPSAKPRRGSPPIPPNYVSLRQLHELRLKEKEEQERRQREEEEAAAAAAAMAKTEAARKAETETMAATAVKWDAARKPETKVSVAPVKERRDGGTGPQWVAVAHRPAVPPPARRESVPEAVPIGVGRGNKGPADAPRGGGKLEGKTKGEGKEKVAAITSAQTRAAEESVKPADASAHGCKSEKGERKGKAKERGKASGDTCAEPHSIGGSGESAGAPYRRRKNPKWKKGAGGRSASAEPSAADIAPVKAADASPSQGVEPGTAGKARSPVPNRADAGPVSDSSHVKNADATPVPRTSAVAGVVSDLRITAETKREGLVEGQRRRPPAEVHVAAEQKPRAMRRRAWPRPPGDPCNGAVEQQHGRVWVPKATAD